jgi:hypothetical protein
MSVLESEEILVSPFTLLQLRVKRFFRQTVRPISIGLVGLILVFALGLVPHSADAAMAERALSFGGQSPVTRESSAPQLSQSGHHSSQSMAAQSAQLMTQYRLEHSRLTSATLTHHRLTGAHLLVSDRLQQTLSANSQQARTTLR